MVARGLCGGGGTWAAHACGVCPSRPHPISSPPHPIPPHPTVEVPGGWWILTGVRVDVPEPGGEECPDEEGTEGDAQDSGQPQPAVCGRMRVSAPPCWGAVGVGGVSPSHPRPFSCPTLTVGRPPAVLHRHLQDLLKDGVVLQRWTLG